MDCARAHRGILPDTLEKVRCSPLDSEEHASACVICLDTISEQATACPCEHNEFDYLCLLSWLQQRPVCPLCKCKPTQSSAPIDPDPGNALVCSIGYQRTSPHDVGVYQVPPNGHETSIRDSASQPYRPRPQIRHPPATRGSRNADSTSRVSANTALERRKQVYRLRLYSLHVGSNREYIPEFYIYLPFDQGDSPPYARSRSNEIASRTSFTAFKHRSAFTLNGPALKFLNSGASHYDLQYCKTASSIRRES